MRYVPYSDAGYGNAFIETKPHVRLFYRSNNNIGTPSANVHSVRNILADATP